MKAIKFVLVGLAFASLTVSSAVANEPVELGVIFPTKTIIGKQAVQGAETAAKQINENGGILGGRKVELIIYDSAFSAVEGVAAAQRLVAQDGVKYVLGEISSTVAFAVTPVVENEGALAIYAMPKHPDITESGYGNIFRLNSTTKIDSESFGAYLTEEVNPSKVAILVQNDDYGLASREDMKKILGDRVVYDDVFAVQQADFSALATNVRASDADLVCVVAANPEQSGGIVKALGDLGYTPELCLWPGLLNNDLPAVAGEAAENVFSQDVYIDTIDSEQNREFVELYTKEYGSVPGKPEVLGFEVVWLAAQAIDQVGSYDDVEAVADAIRTTEWVSPRGVLSFNENGQAQTGPLYNTVVRDGRVVLAN